MHVDPQTNPDTSRCIPPVASIDTIVLPLPGQEETLTAPQTAALGNLVAPRGYAFVVTATQVTTLVVHYRQGGSITIAHAIGTKRYVPQFDVRLVTAASAGVVTAWLEDTTAYKSACPA